MADSRDTCEVWHICTTQRLMSTQFACDVHAELLIEIEQLKRLIKPPRVSVHSPSVSDEM